MGVNTTSTPAQLSAASAQADVDQYIIYVQFRKASNTSEFGQFFYCSYVRQWDEEDCSRARPVCSSPGPMFYLPKDQKIEVAWVYDIQPTNGLTIKNDYIFDNCYFPHAVHSAHCGINNKAAGQRQCTYFDPTNFSYPTAQTSELTINLTTIPISVHVHGLQTRPTFDGSPLSYMTRDGNVGLGFQSLLDDAYFRLFADYEPTTFRIDTNLSLYAKINRYENFQPAGSLWYHDHSMHATWPNVRSGMAGSYIIYDKEAEA